MVENGKSKGIESVNGLVGAAYRRALNRMNGTRLGRRPPRRAAAERAGWITSAGGLGPDGLIGALAPTPMPLTCAWSAFSAELWITDQTVSAMSPMVSRVRRT